MSRFMKLSHSIWHCQYHIIWTPKYRYSVLKGEVKKEVELCIRTYASQQKCIIVELNVVIDHVHLLVKIPPKIAVSNFMGAIKGRTAIRIFQKFPKLKNKPYWGNHFWAQGYCVDTVGLDAEMIKKYVKYQDKKEK
jgi:putative transposase